ncbi:hypothetical protein CLOM_g6349 [Closterium sp. NIES-68]|nr:hypothetical protein CLOM_g6349 [Closterium sp. NIES-68]GJP64720.1 hypothetical protein CLOP_g21679 [Closterium sp. NIES-67]
MEDEEADWRVRMERGSAEEVRGSALDLLKRMEEDDSWKLPSVRRIQVPHVRQQHSWDCGVACVLMVLKALQIPIQTVQTEPNRSIPAVQSLQPIGASPAVPATAAARNSRTAVASATATSAVTVVAIIDAPNTSTNISDAPATATTTSASPTHIAEAAGTATDPATAAATHLATPPANSNTAVGPTIGKFAAADAQPALSPLAAGEEEQGVQGSEQALEEAKGAQAKAVAGRDAEAAGLCAHLPVREGSDAWVGSDLNDHAGPPSHAAGGVGPSLLAAERGAEEWGPGMGGREAAQRHGCVMRAGDGACDMACDMACEVACEVASGRVRAAPSMGAPDGSSATTRGRPPDAGGAAASGGHAGGYWLRSGASVNGTDGDNRGAYGSGSSGSRGSRGSRGTSGGRDGRGNRQVAAGAELGREGNAGTRGGGNKSTNGSRISEQSADCAVGVEGGREGERVPEAGLAAGRAAAVAGVGPARAAAGVGQAGAAAQGEEDARQLQYLHRQCGTTSVWSIDLVAVLHGHGVAVEFLTITIGANPSFASEAFYKENMPGDVDRVNRLFADTMRAGVPIQCASIRIQHLAWLLLSGRYLVIALVDKRTITHPLASERCPPECCGPTPGYIGHFVVVCGFDSQCRMFEICDPSSHGGTSWVPFAALEDARMTFGTDQDLILVRLADSSHSELR